MDHPLIKHGDRMSHNDPITLKTVTRVLWRPDAQRPGQWLTPAEWVARNEAAAPAPMAHVDRMRTEQEALQSNVNAENAFLDSKKSQHLKPLQRQLLRAQVFAMESYLTILSTRINNELDCL